MNRRIFRPDLLVDRNERFAVLDIPEQGAQLCEVRFNQLFDRARARHLNFELALFDYRAQGLPKNLYRHHRASTSESTILLHVSLLLLYATGEHGLSFSRVQPPDRNLEAAERYV
jgi:hypothetical protein